MTPRLVLLALTSVLTGCHPQAARGVMSAQLPPLEKTVLEGSLRPWVEQLAVCLEDLDVVPGTKVQTEKAALHLSINDNGAVQNVSVQVADADINGCIARKATDWVLPRGSFTAADVDILISAKSAQLAEVHVRPALRTADSR